MGTRLLRSGSKNCGRRLHRNGPGRRDRYRRRSPQGRADKRNARRELRRHVGGRHFQRLIRDHSPQSSPHSPLLNVAPLNSRAGPCETLKWNGISCARARSSLRRSRLSHFSPRRAARSLRPPWRPHIRFSRPSSQRAHRRTMAGQSISRERRRAPGANATRQPISAGAACLRGSFGRNVEPPTGLKLNPERQGNDRPKHSRPGPERHASV